MRWIWALASLLFLPACATDGGASGDTNRPEPVECGDDLCGASEYCVTECLCCGIPTDAGPSSASECRPIPAECDPDDLCACPALAGGRCDAEQRLIEIPCA